MLKLTNSFCRYLKLKYEKLNNRTDVKCLAHLRCHETAGCTESSQSKTVDTPLTSVGHQLRFLSSFKKKSHHRRNPCNCNEAKKSKQMSERLNPNLNHVSYGGQFQVSTEESSPTREWRKNVGGSQSPKGGDQKGSCLIPPDFRVWEQVLKKRDCDGNLFKFKIMSYNVLAQYLLENHPYLYTDCTPHNLKWKVRAAKLYDEIEKIAPDILCLQEVQVSHLQSFYGKFEQIGYFGVFKRKTGNRQDGCAIYFKESLFELKDHITVEFYQPELPLLNRDNVGLMVKLLPKNATGIPIIVATTHLLYNPKRTDVRLAQIQLFLAEIDRFAYYNNGRESGYFPIILTGDFNSTPDSAVIKLLDRGQVTTSPFRDCSDWEKIGVTDNCQHLSVYLNRLDGLGTDSRMIKIRNTDVGGEELEVECSVIPDENFSQFFNSGVIGHPLNLMSAYNTYKQNGQYEATTFQDFWVTVDYIYFSCCSNLRLLDRLRLPTTVECDVLGKLPNDVYGSDHLALVAVFGLTPCKSSL